MDGISVRKAGSHRCGLTSSPEPLFVGSARKARRWSCLQLEQLIRENIWDFRKIRNVELIKFLVELLPKKVGSPSSINSLRDDLQVAYATVREWMVVLQQLYIYFRVPPYYRHIARSLIKESNLQLIFDHFSHNISPRRFSEFYSYRLVRQIRPGHYIFYINTLYNGLESFDQVLSSRTRKIFTFAKFYNSPIIKDFLIFGQTLNDREGVIRNCS